MKKIGFLLVLVVMMVLALPGLAGAPTEYEIPELGAEIGGFTVTDVFSWDDYATDVVELTHQKTGCVLYWLANDNIDRSCRITYLTPAYDDTGVPHVFEHATLAGSDKYPGANTFFEMTSKTSNTYLNAQTSQCFTSYPMASTSEEQLLKFVDYYVNGLLNPFAISDPYAMMREAYRYELNDPDGEITIQGIVYSEMLGALTQNRMAAYNQMKMLWPGSRISMISGGDPAHIPELTIERLREFHENYYHPSNATIYLTGDIYLPDFLELLETEYLNKFEWREIVIEDMNYTPLEPGYYEQVFTYPVEEGMPTDKTTVMIYSFRFDVLPENHNDLNVLVYAASYLNDESSFFKRALKERLPEAGGSVSVSYNPDCRYSLDFSVMSVNESDRETFKAICDETLEDLLQNGVNGDVLHAILVNEQFSDLMQLDDSSVYLDVSGIMSAYWAIFGERDAIKREVEFSSQLNELVSVENCNEMVRKYWANLDTAVMAITVQEPGLKEKNDEALRSRLAEMKAAMSADEVSALVEQTKNYQAFYEESNQITMPESLNALSVDNLPEEISYTEASETSVGGVRVITADLDSPLIRISIINNAGVIPFEDLFDFIEYTNLIGDMNTEKYTREELPSKAASVSNSMSLVVPALYENTENREFEFKTVTYWYTLPELLEDSFALAEEILYHTDFSDYDYIRNNAAQRYASSVNALTGSALSIGISTAFSAYSDISKFSEYLDGTAYIRYLDKVSKMTDEELDQLTGKFELFRDMLLNKNDAVLTVIGNNENTLRTTALGYEMISRFNTTKYETADYTAVLGETTKRIAIPLGGNVAYNMAFTDIEAAGYEQNDGKLMVIASLFEDKLLFPELRFKNSAYGGYALYNDYLFGFYSYRDPKVAETFEVYRQAGDFLRNLEISESELDGYIISVYGNLISPVGPISSANRGIRDKVYHENSRENTLKMIRDIREFKPEDIKLYADLADRLGTDDSVIVTAGSKTMIEANAELYETINYDYLETAGTAAEEETAQ